jgi:hypothetical protein
LPTSAFTWQGTYNLTADPIYPWTGTFNWDNGFPADRCIAPKFDVSRGDVIALNVVDPNCGSTPYIQDWNMNIQMQFPKNILLNVGYGGNKATRLALRGLSRSNQVPASEFTQHGSRLNNPMTIAAQASAKGVAYPFGDFAGTVASSLRRYPQAPGFYEIAANGLPLGFSNHSSPQAAGNKQFRKGRSLYANYVWSRALANINSTLLDYYSRRREKSAVSWDAPHMVQAYIRNNPPFGKGGTVGGTLPGWPKRSSAGRPCRSRTAGTVTSDQSSSTET